MQPVSLSEIKTNADYEIERATFRPLAMAAKDRRRVQVGGHLTFLFENRLTVRYQIQEMMRIERLSKLEEIKHEVQTYNELIPGTDQLCACLLIEYETPELRAVWLRELLGLEDHIWVDVPGAGRAKAVFDDRQIASDRISSVQYIKFQLTPEQVAGFPQGANLVVDHPKYLYNQPLGAAQLEELTGDFK